VDRLKHLFDLNASIETGERFEVDLFVKNLLDEYGILNAPFSFAGSVVRPRTIGATHRYSME
jgi:iron complex outermembrane recepter protein